MQMSKRWFESKSVRLSIQFFDQFILFYGDATCSIFDRTTLFLIVLSSIKFEFFLRERHCQQIYALSSDYSISNINNSIKNILFFGLDLTLFQLTLHGGARFVFSVYTCQMLSLLFLYFSVWLPFLSGHIKISRSICVQQNFVGI